MSKHHPAGVTDPEILNQISVDLGFESRDEMNDLIRRYEIKSASELACFGLWEEMDGTKERLLDMIKAQEQDNKPWISEETLKKIRDGIDASVRQVVADEGLAEGLKRGIDLNMLFASCYQTQDVEAMRALANQLDVEWED